MFGRYKIGFSQEGDSNMRLRRNFVIVYHTDALLFKTYTKIEYGKLRNVTSPSETFRGTVIYRPSVEVTRDVLSIKLCGLVNLR